jgi:hypothetical protein
MRYWLPIILVPLAFWAADRWLNNGETMRVLSRALRQWF